MASPLIGQVVGPGDQVMRLPESGVVHVGSGLYQADTHIVTMRPGVLRSTAAGKLWVEGDQSRYIPAVNDAVVGTVIDRIAESYSVDIGAPFSATLPLLAFEGATRRNRPHLQAGDLVYARVTSANRDADPEITCTDAMGKASGLGPLAGGYAFSCSGALARRLLSRPAPAVLSSLGASLEFELAVGQNGQVWVNASAPEHTILIANTLQRSHGLSEVQCQILVKQLLAQL